MPGTPRGIHPESALECVTCIEARWGVTMESNASTEPEANSPQDPGLLLLGLILTLAGRKAEARVTGAPAARPSVSRRSHLCPATLASCQLHTTHPEGPCQCPL